MHEKKQKLPIYKRNWFIILLLVLFAPVGLFLTWKYADWKRSRKIIATAAVALLATLLIIIGLNAPATITVNNLGKNNTINTDDASYTLTGNVSTLHDTILTINGEKVSFSDSGDFSKKLDLKEGDNSIELVATSEKGTTKETVTIHRTTQAEFAERARKAAEEKAKKEAAEKAAADKKKADEDAAAKKKAQEEADKKKSSSNSSSSSTNKSQATQSNKISQSAAENYCQDANLLQNYIDISKTSIVTTSYSPWFGDSGMKASNGNPIYTLQWNGKDKSNGKAIGFVCDVSGSDKNIKLHNLAINGTSVYGPEDEN